MYVRLFDVQDKVVIPAECVYQIEWLKNIIDEYPSNHMKVFAYIQFMTCIDPQHNPYMNVPEEDRERVILSEIGADFDPEDDMIMEAIEKGKNLNSTPPYRAWKAAKSAMDRLSKFLEETIPTTGKDGSVGQITALMKQLPDLRASYNKLYQEMMEETKSRVRGQIQVAYDQQ